MHAPDCGIIGTVPAPSSAELPARPGSQWPWVLLRAALAVLGTIAWAGATSSASTFTRIGLVAAAAGAILAAWGRHVGLALITIGVMALALHGGTLDTLDGWALLFLAALSSGAALALRQHPGLRWVAASAPFWALSHAMPLFVAIALAMSVGGLMIAAVGPTLPGRRRPRDATPRPQLAGGPLVPVEARVYFGGQRNRWLARAAWMLAALAVALPMLAAFDRAGPEVGALGLACAIIAATFAFANWFATRVRLRIDGTGLHSRTLFGEQTIRWHDVSGLTIRSVLLPGYNIRIVMFVAYSPAREFAFSSRMPGSDDLRTAIERAVGLRFPEPDLEANFP